MAVMDLISAFTKREKNPRKRIYYSRQKADGPANRNEIELFSTSYCYYGLGKEGREGMNVEGGGEAEPRNIFIITKFRSSGCLMSFFFFSFFFVVVSGI